MSWFSQRLVQLPLGEGFHSKRLTLPECGSRRVTYVPWPMALGILMDDPELRRGLADAALVARARLPTWEQVTAAPLPRSAG